jgi:predicted DNA-binding protein
MTLSVRLDDETKKLLSRMARARRTSRSEIVRQAIHAFANEDSASNEVSVYDRMKHVIGSVHSGRGDLSENTGEKFFQIVLEKHRRRQK